MYLVGAKWVFNSQESNLKITYHSADEQSFKCDAIESFGDEEMLYRMTF
jgi:hypothetical protein